MSKETMMQNLSNKDTSKLYKFFNSPIPIIVVLILFSIGILIYNRYLINNVNLYSFSGYEENFSITNGIIFIGYDINYFADSKIIYTGEKIEIYDFEIGYYIKNDGNYYEISKMSGVDIKDDNDKKITVSLEDVLKSSDFSFTEVHKEALFLSKVNVKNLENLVFRVQGKKETGENVNIEIPLDVKKITK